MQGKAKSPGRSIPLNCVDKCLLALDGIDERMLLYVILDLEGEVDHARLNQAIVSAQQAHPVMRTTLRGTYFSPFRQIQEDLPEGPLCLQDLTKLQGANYESLLFQWMNQPMDVRKEVPLRVVLLRKDEIGCSVVFTFNHSATDGLGAFLFVRRVIESYNNEVSEASPAAEDTRTSRKGDQLLEFADSQRSRVEHHHVKTMYSLFRRFVMSAFPLPTRVYHDRSGNSKELHLCLATVSPRGLEQVESKARSAGVGLNDILLAACHRAVEKWNSMHGKGTKRIRIMFPVDIGPKGFRHLVSNQVSWISPSTMPEDRADPAKLLTKVRADTAYAARNRTAFHLVYFFHFCSRFPLVVMRCICRFLMVTRTYVDTILLTNVGAIWPGPSSNESALTRMGRARIVNVAGSAPVVTPMGLSIAVAIYNRNLNLCLTYRPALFSRDSAEKFLDLYAEEVRNYQASSQAVGDTVR
jgi:NRPS condensation-like uncharacterized protein